MDEKNYGGQYNQGFSGGAVVSPTQEDLTKNPEYVCLMKQMCCWCRRLGLFMIVVAVPLVPCAIALIVLGGINGWKWPIWNVFPLVCGVMFSVVGVVAWKVGKYDTNQGLTLQWFRSFITVYYLTISNISNISLALMFTGQGLGKCASSHEDCSENRDAQMAIQIVCIVLCVLLLPGQWALLSMYCKGGQKLRKAFPQYRETCCGKQTNCG